MSTHTPVSGKHKTSKKTENAQVNAKNWVQYKKTDNKIKNMK